MPSNNSRHSNRVIALSIATLLTVVLVGCGPAESPDIGGTVTGSSTEKPFGGTRAAKHVFNDSLEAGDDLVKHSTASWPSWDRHDLAGYNGQACRVESSQDGRYYRTRREAGAVVDPDAEIAAMKAHWESLGYTIGNIFTNMGGNVTARQINATTPNGGFVQYTPGKTRSSFLIKSDCTLDPAGREITTVTSPLDETTTIPSTARPK
ncbi:hypothetical protein ACX80E_17085 [Arthrobacter sp. TMN-49]